jgi:clan AA aspartic protease
MIRGSVKAALEAIVRLTVRGPQGQRRRISAVIDTGYNGTLTLPPDVIADLGLPWIQIAEVTLGDGSTIECNTFAGIVVWNRKPINILIEEAEATPLVGMELMQGFRLTIDVERRGRMTIKPLRRRRGGAS